MNTKQRIKKLLTDTCVYFSIIILLYDVVVAIINTDANEILISGVRVMFFFIFSLLFSLANLVYGIKSMSTPARLICHYFITIFAVYICLLLPASLRPSGMLVGIVFFTILYAIFAAMFAFISSVRRKNANQKEVYTNKFAK